MSSGLQQFWQGTVTEYKDERPFPFISLATSPDSCTTMLPVCEDTQDTSSKGAMNVAEEVLPISAPVPVYASLGKDALRSILEMRHGESTAEQSQAHTLVERLTPDATEKNLPQGRPFQWSNNLAHSQNGNATESKMVIRPITPSTLIALTEPCLLAWCYANVEDNIGPKNNGIGEASADSIQTPHYLESFCIHLDYSETGRMTNMWGY